MALMEKLDSVNDALPKDFNKQRFVRILTLIHDNPKLMEYKQSEIMSGLMKGATLGLDFFNKEAYLVPYGNQLNYQTDYRGAKKLAKKYSIRPIKDIYAKLVREGDELEEVIANGEQSINFKPKLFNDGKIIGAFAVCVFADGGLIYDTMSIADLENTRKSSKASNSPAWKNFTGKCTKRRCCIGFVSKLNLTLRIRLSGANFIAGMEIETDVSEISHREIAENENSQPFEVVADVEAKEEPSFVTEG